MTEAENPADTIAIRAFAATDWEILRNMRLAALKDCQGKFGVSHDEAATYSSDHWKSTTKGVAHQVFGLFDGTRPIGITAAFTERSDPSGETALFAMSYILSEYRGRGLSRLLYEARLSWVRAQPQFRRVTLSHRKLNEASRRANQRHGFVYTKTAPRVWPDGTTEDELFYELQISR